MPTDSSSRKISVLIVDDSITVRAMVERLIDASPDLEVIGVTSCAGEARAFCETNDPDVMTLDIEMPGMDGLEFLKNIMARRPMPVVMLSSSTTPGADSCYRAKALGAAGCFNKADVPTNANGLLAMIRSAAKGKKRSVGVLE